MFETIIVLLIVAAALAYVARSLIRRARGQACGCRAGTCPLAKDRVNTPRPCDGASPMVPLESLETSARHLSR